jgi:hypothetical protein
LDREKIASDGRAFVNRALDAHGLSIWSKTQSLDMGNTEDGIPLIEQIADEDALDAFDRMFDEEETEY